MPNPLKLCPTCQAPIPPNAPGGMCPACLLLGAAIPTEPAPGALASAPSVEQVVAAFPELEIIELFAHGGMGVIYKARQPRLDRLVALKILPPNLARQPGFTERFTREARALARLNHPHIVAVYDFGERAGLCFLIMEFVNGVNLRQAMRAGITPEQALALVPGVCEALQFAHDHGVLHRDIKPENILLDVKGTPKLADFGIAKLAEEKAENALTLSGDALGTAAYMAPEQIEKPASVDHRADIYSLGVVLYEMLTGELPLGRFAAPSSKAKVNAGVDDVVLRALEKERERRQQSATEMKTQVEQANTGASVLPEIAKGYTSQQTVARGPGRVAAIAGAWLHVVPLICAIYLAQYVAEFREYLGPGGRHLSEFYARHGFELSIVASIAGVTAIFGLFATLLALVLFRYRAPWFFWWVTFYGALTAPVVVGIFILGYSLVRRREFYAEHVSARAIASETFPWQVPLIFGAMAIPFSIMLAVLAPPWAGFGFSRSFGVALVCLLPLFVALYSAIIVSIFRGIARAGAPRWLAGLLATIITLLLPVAILWSSTHVAVGTVVETRSGLSSFDRASPMSVVTPAAPPFEAKWAQGSVELIAIAANRRPTSWWRMDGAKADAGPFVNPANVVYENDDERAYEFYFRTRNLPANASTPRFMVEHSRASSTGGIPALAVAPEKPLAGYHVVASTVPRDLTVVNIKAGLAYEPWHTLSTSHPKNSIGTTARHQGLEWEITHGTAIESKDGELIVTFSHSRHDNWEERVIAVNTDGVEIATSRLSRLNEQAEWHFPGLRLDSVKELGFQVRPFRWVEFRHVALRAGS
jgi:tRNA A-37 threonylcarbamoyl transferase component Bud32